METSHDFIRTYTGKDFYFQQPTYDSIDIEDIAHALSYLCRFGGHCAEFYSVAQHCYLASKMFSDDDPTALAALLHDAAEAYIGDIVTPFKKLLGEGFYEMEKNIERAIYTKYGVEYPVSKDVKLADRLMLMREFNTLPPFKDDEKLCGLWDNEGGFAVSVIGKYGPVIPVHQAAAKRLFLDRFHTLMAKGNGVCRSLETIYGTKTESG